jgi:hypothetical protein
MYRELQAVLDNVPEQLKVGVSESPDIVELLWVRIGKRSQELKNDLIMKVVTDLDRKGFLEEFSDLKFPIIESTVVLGAGRQRWYAQISLHQALPSSEDLWNPSASLRLDIYQRGKRSGVTTSITRKRERNKEGEIKDERDFVFANLGSCPRPGTEQINQEQQDKLLQTLLDSKVDLFQTHKLFSERSKDSLSPWGPDKVFWNRGSGLAPI